MSLASAAVSVGGRYRLDHHVATGPSADVWRATDLELSRPVAVKLLHSQFGRESGALDRFRASARCAASLVHQGIARVFDYDEPDSADAAGRPFLVMEFVDGPPLADLLASGPVGAAQTLDVIAQAAAALDVAHRAGCVHGDLGPRNILLRRDGTAKLIVFGAGHGAAGKQGTAAGDLYALGAVAYRCLTGSKAPADAAVPVLPEQTPASVAAFVSQLLAREPATAAEVGRRAARLRDRLTPAGRVSRGLAAVSRARRPATPAATGMPPTATMPDIPAPRGRPAKTRRRGRFAVPALAVVALTLAAMLLLGVFRPGGTAPDAAGTTKITTVRVNAARLTGQPVNVARRHLKRLGLMVRVRWQPSDRVSPGKVLSVRPAGRVPAHSRIILTGSIRPSGATSAPPAAPQASRPAQHRGPPRTAPRRPGTQPPHPAPSTAPASSPAPSASPSPSSDPPATSPPPHTSPPPSSSPAPSSGPPLSSSPPPPGR